MINKHTISEAKFISLKLRYFFFFILLIFIYNLTPVFGQSTDSILSHKNNIKLNVSSIPLYGSAFIPSYERLINHKQSFSVEFGLVGIPNFDSITTRSLNISHQNQKYGFKASIDYRFYLLSENKYDIPRGLYLGPFMSYYRFNTVNKFSYTDSTQNMAYGEIDGDLNLYQAGFQLGYQFVFWDRMSVDLILLGPALSYYNASLIFTGEIANESEVLQEFLNAFLELYPGISTLFETGEVDTHGRADFLVVDLDIRCI